MDLARGKAMNLYQFLAGRKGLTLIEVLVALMVAGLLAAMVASLLGRGIVFSSALKETAQGQQARVTLRRVLDLDLRNMIPEATFQVAENGFSLSTSHNHLIPGPLPVTATWTFSRQGIERREEEPELDYAQTLVLIRSLDAWELEYFDLTEGRWLEARTWLHSPDRPAPAGLRLRLTIEDIGLVEIVQRLPLHSGNG